MLNIVKSGLNILCAGPAKKIMIGVMSIGILMSLSGIANATLSTYYTSGDSREWANPFDTALVNKNYSGQLAAMTPDFQFALLSEVKTSAANDGFTADLAGVTQWLTMKFFGGTNPSVIFSVCGAFSSCDIRLGDLVGLSHAILVSGQVSYGYGSVNNNTAGTSDLQIGALAYRAPQDGTVPEPSSLALLGFSVLALGYMAYRRKKALA